MCECFLVPAQEKAQHFVDLDSCHLLGELSQQEPRFARVGSTSTLHVGCIHLNGLKCSCCLLCPLDCIGFPLCDLHACRYASFPVPPQEKAQHSVNLEACHLLSELSQQEPRFARVGVTSDLHVGCIVLNGSKCNLRLIWTLDCIGFGLCALHA